jgi:hypothetical protein
VRGVDHSRKIGERSGEDDRPAKLATGMPLKDWIRL